MAAKIKTGIERRGSIRANRVVAIRHRLHQHVSKKTEMSWSLSTTRNMSVTGLLFLSDTSYKPGDILEVNVTMSGVIDIIQGFAEVVRVSEKTGHSYEVAAELVDLKPHSRSAKSHLG